MNNLTALELYIEDHDHDKALKTVVMYGTTNDGRMSWWSIFDGTESECQYFKDNFNKGLEFLKGDE